ncbi:hypothetical protein [Persicitalea jodogahamensis]|uniref:Lipoprotein n=1 Tax=Persicitalea jodogahamensis TaxID=402147 RepID=A0A8J3DE41_9BACT|nr:hypothetical protein [Persicitalea jodogahamensis]GHB88153.1 hypothetical protein GCM10007390_50250 [Persicitalea jodogahamensis]
MKKYLLSHTLIVLLLLSITGCRSEEDKSMIIELRNNTSAEIPKVQVVAVGSAGTRLLAEKENLAAGVIYRQSARYKSFPDSDGSYELRLTEVSGNRTFRFGYFTNGTALDKYFFLQIEKDTVLVSSIARELKAY